MLPIYGQVHPLPAFPNNWAVYLIPIWMVVGAGYLMYLKNRRPDLISAMGRVFQGGQSSSPASPGSERADPARRSHPDRRSAPHEHLHRDQSGARMAAEMAEQPRVLANLAARFDEITAPGASTAASRPRGIAFLARGSSDNAALFGRYATEVYSGLPTCLLAPSVITAHRRVPTGFEGWLLVALSQSGRTPEIVDRCRTVRPLRRDRHLDH